MIARHVTFPVALLLPLAALVSSSTGDSSYIRREAPARTSAELDPMMAEDSRVLASVSSDGNIASLARQGARQERVAASLKAYQNNYLEVEAMLEQIRRKDVFDENGFEVQQVPMHQRLEEIKQERKMQADQLLEMEKLDAGRAAAHMEALQERGKASQLLQSKEESEGKKKMAATYDGRDAVVTGFWAKDRPNEERIDPDNMKIYTFASYKKRFPFTHSWGVEVMWKKLPLAPRMVHQVQVQHEQSPGDSNRPVLMQSSTMLVDDQMRELVWTKDSNGYYHMGREIPTEEEIFAISHPREAKLRKAAQKRRLKKKMSGLYSDLSSHINNIKDKLTSPRRIDREDATHRLEHMFMEMQSTLKQPPKKAGKAFISARGADGYLCSFNADVGKVNGRTLKNRIENATGIPWEAQKLRIKGQDIKDTELLNVHIGAGHSAWIEVSTSGWEITQHALIKRGKIAQPTAHRQPESNEILAETQANSHVMQEPSSTHSRSSSSSSKPKPAAVIEDDQEVDQDESSWASMSDDVDFAKHPMVYKPTVPKEETPTHNQAQMEQMEHQVKDLILKSMEAQELAKKADSLAKQAAAPPQHAVVTRKMVYTKDEDGHWHVEKVAVTASKKEEEKHGALPGHNHHPHAEASHFQKLWNGVDEGIPVQDRLLEIDSQGAEQLLELQGKSSPKKESGHLTKAQKGMEAFRKLQKHAQSDEMKWRLKQKKIRESKIGQKATAAAKPKVPKASLAENPAYDEDMQEAAKKMKAALGREQAWENQEEAREAAHAKEHRTATPAPNKPHHKSAVSVTAKTKPHRRKKLFGSSVPAQEQDSTSAPPTKRHRRKLIVDAAQGRESKKSETSEADVSEGVVDADATSFIQLSSLSASSRVEPAASSLESDTAKPQISKKSKGLKDAALEEATRSKVQYVLEKKSERVEAIAQANTDRVKKVKAWIAAANPTDDYEGRTFTNSLTEISKRRTKRNKAYDGMRAVGSGFWADDRPDERRVDISDHKIYTWRQYRLKHADQHSWNLEAKWKKLPTEKRVKKLGKSAFIQRFR